MRQRQTKQSKTLWGVTSIQQIFEVGARIIPRGLSGYNVSLLSMSIWEPVGAQARL